MKRAWTIFALAPLLSCSDPRQSAFEDAPPPFRETPPPDAENCVEAFADTERAVDIIMSIDQSGSMREEVSALSTNINLLPSLLSASGLNYRIAMVAGVGRDVGNVCIPPPLGGEDCSSNGTTFRAVDQHVESEDTLALLLATLDDPVRGWHDFLRPNVLKVFVPITDDDSGELSAAEFAGELHRRDARLFGSEDAPNYVFFPVIGASDFPDARPCPTAMNAGHQYQRLVERTKGKWFSVCTPSLRSVLEEIGTTLQDTVACEVAIPEPPAGATLDFARINIRITQANGSPVVVPQDSGRACAAGADGWQFSEDRKKILLCGNACNSVRSDPAAKFTVGFGCNTLVR